MRSFVFAVSALALLTACGQPPAPAAGPPTVAADDHAGHDHAGPFTLTATPTGTLALGQPVTLTLRLTDRDGQPLDPADLREDHGHLLHVMAVDTGLEDYTHAHPTAGPDGTFSFTFTPRLDRPYRLWTDFHLAHDDETAADHGDHDHNDAGHGDHAHGDGHEAGQRASTDLGIGGGVAPPLAATQSLTAEAGGLRFQLSLPGALKVGEATRVQIAIVGLDGQPFTQLEPLMGAFAHVVGFNVGATEMLHAHPEGPEPANAAARGGPVLAVTLEPETAGPQRLFVQVKANGAEITAPFTVLVSQ
jgi:hypothetical protein